MKKYFGVILFLIVTVICFSGCFYDLVIPESDLNSEDTENGSSSPTQEDGVVPGKGTLKIYLTDAPGDYSEVNITIYKIQIHLAGEDEEDEGEWIEWLLTDPLLRYNLIELKDKFVLLSEDELTSGKYTQIRLFITDPEILLNEGVEYITLIIPSADQTGIKLIHPFEIVDGGITVLTIDFDAEKSVIKTGNGKYKMKPVISVSSENYSIGEFSEEVGLGSVSGSVSYYNESLELVGIGNANIELTGGAYIFANTATTSEDPGSKGTFILNNVPAGSYTLNVYAEGYDDYSQSVLVANGENTVVDVVLLSGGISGIVVDSLSGLPISEANVSVTLSGGVYIFNSSASTNESGQFVVEQLPVGIYDLIASATGYANSSVSGIPVTEGSLNNLITPIVLVPFTP